jgi:hypothetical protein
MSTLHPSFQVYSLILAQCATLSYKPGMFASALCVVMFLSGRLVQLCSVWYSAQSIVEALRPQVGPTLLRVKLHALANATKSPN